MVEPVLLVGRAVGKGVMYAKTYVCFFPIHKYTDTIHNTHTATCNRFKRTQAYFNTYDI